MSTRHVRTVAAASGFLGCILAANYVTSRFGMVPVGFGLAATAGTYFAGLSFILRDAVHDLIGKSWTLAVIAIGAVLSFAVASPMIALASAAAFLIAETTDLAVYGPLRRHGYIRAALASNVIGSLVDTVVFLFIARFPVAPALPGQMASKLAVTATVVTLVVIARAVPRQPLRTEGRGSNA